MHHKINPLCINWGSAISNMAVAHMCHILSLNMSQNLTHTILDEFSTVSQWIFTIYSVKYIVFMPHIYLIPKIV